ncbi:hypothetical protein [Pantoea stewartii]|uniref:Uncharacterized protein n=1 Tax=Pantoea stewartii subsp. stewartii DC283 TaxID=660596 RepID=H3RBK7_PANSE|nr:hypothetical protein [Pantoea stewartii]ARF48186.1 hypothetical protein DSJ_01495 [Pantoea stewartii subsp. stewartii DC283]ARF49647.1 hypothetical protein DSJ_10050 [Pantoea stewartii subsp. stewartii DC283]EHT99068.1 hypothetical protein CKS_0979 [Pantoea stewartii subsp. stewartii DC283]EHU01346.1 hypothetical protein CKS_4098 [Pantoea stewartii subsp. stewartii DC283]KAB0545308.1 hypothetical protein F7Q90_25375 [Pantoea stewartii subsp. stewartii]
MRNNLTRFELIDKSCQASTYLNQARGVLCSMLDAENSDSETSWRYGALLTLICAACDEIEPAMNSTVKEPEGKA